MNPERILQRLGKRAAILVASRAPEVAKAARRARGAAAAARSAVLDDADLRLVVTAALEAVIIVSALESRDRRRGDRRRAQSLDARRAAAPRKVSDAEIMAALVQTGGHARRAAAILQVAPSTITRRRVAVCDSTQHLPADVPSEPPAA